MWRSSAIYTVITVSYILRLDQRQ